MAVKVLRPKSWTSREFPKVQLFFFFFKISKIFVKSLLLLLYVLVFWPWGIWDPSPMTRDWTCTPCIKRQVLTTGLPGKPPEVQLLSQYMVTCVSFPCDNLCVSTGNRHKKELLVCKLTSYFFLWFLVTFFYIFHEDPLFWMCIMLLSVSFSICSIKVTLSTSNKYTAVNAFRLHSP